MPSDLNRLHHAVHQVRGDMALRFNKATVDDLMRWAKALRKLADEMEAEAVRETVTEIVFP
jgi:hypothetical protein